MRITTTTTVTGIYIVQLKDLKEVHRLRRSIGTIKGELANTFLHQLCFARDCRGVLNFEEKLLQISLYI